PCTVGAPGDVLAGIFCQLARWKLLAIREEQLHIHGGTPPRDPDSTGRRRDRSFAPLQGYSAGRRISTDHVFRFRGVAQTPAWCLGAGGKRGVRAALAPGTAVAVTSPLAAAPPGRRVVVRTTPGWQDPEDRPYPFNRFANPGKMFTKRILGNLGCHIRGGRGG